MSTFLHQFSELFRQRCLAVDKTSDWRRLVRVFFLLFCLAQRRFTTRIAETLGMCSAKESTKCFRNDLPRPHPAHTRLQSRGGVSHAHELLALTVATPHALYDHRRFRCCLGRLLHEEHGQIVA